MIFVDEIFRLEWDWVGVDRDGSIAILTTAGSGVVPCAQACAPEMRLLVDELLARPGTSEVSTIRRACASTQDGRALDLRDWEEMSKRGYFAYDYDADSGMYLLVAEPTKPRIASELNLTKEVCVKIDLRFSEVNQIDLEWGLP